MFYLGSAANFMVFSKLGRGDGSISAAGEEMASESSDSQSDDPKLRHHLLRHKLALDEGTSDKAGLEDEVGPQENERKEKRKRSLCKLTFKNGQTRKHYLCSDVGSHFLSS